MTDKEIKLKEFMAWCNNELLKWKEDLKVEYVNPHGAGKITIKKLGSEFFTGIVMKNIIEVSEELDLSCFFCQDNGDVCIEIF
jgi:hypothetical protein